jgi:hypothetical protein
MALPFSSYILDRTGVMGVFTSPTSVDPFNLSNIRGEMGIDMPVAEEDTTSLTNAWRKTNE